MNKGVGRIVEVAEAIVDILTNVGPASKTGLCGRMTLGYNTYPYFDAALHYARMNLLSEIGKPIAYSHLLDQYGFPEDLTSAEAYIVRFNGQYLATRAQTMVEQAQLAMQQFSASTNELDQFTHIAGSFAFAMSALVGQFAESVRVQRGAQATGARAKVYLER
jgi:hypothetical protein